MSRVQEIERQIKDLLPDELAIFRDWFTAFDTATWDLQFEAHVNAGKFDDMAKQALQDHAAGRSRKL